MVPSRTATQWWIVLVVLCLLLAGCGRLGRAIPRRDAAATAAQDPQLAVAARVTELEQQLREREQELAEARAELTKLKHVEAGEERLTKGQGVPPTKEQQKSENTGAEADPTALGAQLARERLERQALLQELDRLRQEVSSPFGDSSVPEAEYLALKQELLELRKVVQEQEQQQRDLMLKLAALSPPPAAGNSAGAAGITPEPSPLVAETQQELTLSRQRIAQLEAALEAAKKEGDRAVALVHENNSLRSQLAEERRRADALEAKLKVAARVTDLIFRMRTQGHGGTQKKSAPEWR